MAGNESGNYLVMNAGLRPLVGFNFIMRVEGIYDMPCKSIRVAQKENEFEYIQEGGLNDYVHMKRKPISKPFTFEVERYCNIDFLDPLSLGTELVLPVVILVDHYQGHFNSIPSRMYVFTGCVVTAKNYGDLESEKSYLMTETTTIAYREMFCINNPAVNYSKEPWKMDPRKDRSGAYKGNTTVKYAKNGPSTTVTPAQGVFDIHNPSTTIGVNDRDRPTQKTKQEMLDRRKIYDFEEPDKAVGRNDEYDVGELRKTEMEERANVFDIHHPETTVGANLGVIKRPGEKDQVIRPSQKDKQQLEKAAKKYNFRKPLKPVGRNDQNRPPQLVKKDMQGKAKAYDFKKPAKHVGVNDAGRPIQINKSLMKKRAQRFSIKTPDSKVGRNDANRPREIPSATMKKKAKAFSIRRPSRQVGMNNTNRPPQLAKTGMEKRAVHFSFGSHLNVRGNNAGRPVQLPKEAMEDRATKYGFQTGIHVGRNEFAHIPEPSQEEMEARSTTFTFGSNERVGANPLFPINEASKSTMESKARNWPPVRSAQSVASFLKKK